MLLVIDNYDSFVHNLARYFRRLGQTTHVVRNDVIGVDDVEDLAPQAIILSPGPGTPDDAGISLEVVRRYANRIPILGVCLGHQTIAQAFGASVDRSQEPMHGRSSWIEHDGRGIFAGVPNPLQVGRYHSLIVNDLGHDLSVTATTTSKAQKSRHPNDRGSKTSVVMGIAHREFPVIGVQFHPESVLTQFGYRILANFLTVASIPPGRIPEPEWDEHALERSADKHSQELGSDWPTDPISF